MEANNSFYQYWLLVGGVSFGIADLSYLKHGELSDVRVIFPVLISFALVIAILLKKRRLENRGEQTAALSRRYRHICADYLCIAGTTSLFSMLAYIVMNDITLAQGWILSRFAIVILINTILFGAGMSLLSALSGDERRKLRWQ